MLENLEVNPEIGLRPEDKSDIKRREAQYGSNYKAPPEKKPFCSFFAAAMDDFMLKILLVAAVVSIVIDMSLADADHRKLAWIEGFAILMAVFVVSSVGAYNDWAKDV